MTCCNGVWSCNCPSECCLLCSWHVIFSFDSERGVDEVKVVVSNEKTHFVAVQMREVDFVQVCMLLAYFVKDVGLCVVGGHFIHNENFIDVEFLRVVSEGVQSQADCAGV